MASWSPAGLAFAIYTVANLLPRALAQRIHVADDQGTELTLAAEAGAVAGIARQRAPDLLVDLRREGFEFTSIRIRVQVGVPARTYQKPLAKQVDRSGLRSLAAFAQGLPAGPLKSALSRFLRSSGHEVWILIRHTLKNAFIPIITD